MYCCVTVALTDTDPLTPVDFSYVPHTFNAIQFEIIKMISTIRQTTM